MQVSSVRFQEINHEFRIDSEFYREEVLNRLDVLNQKNRDKLSALAEFVIGPFGSTVTVDQYTKTSKYRYVRNKDISDFRIRTDDQAYVSKDIYDSLPRFQIQNQDLLITVVGTLGKVAMATSENARSIFSCKSTLIRPKGINPFFLLTYLNSDTGQLFSLRGKRGAIQEGLNLTDLEEIQVFIPSSDFQLMIERVVKVAFANLDEAAVLLSCANELLLSELNLLDRKPKHQQTYVKSFSDTQQAERTDAEYFQPKYQEIINAVKSYPGGWDTLGNLVSISKCVEVGSEAYLNSGIPFVRVSNLSPFEITEEKYISEELYGEIEIHQPKQGEILFSKDATPGIAHFLTEEPPRMIPSGGILRLRSKTDRVNNEYLTLVLNSVITKEQMNRDVGGSVILHWRPDQVRDTVIPILPAEVQTQIQGIVTQSFALRRESKRLLECAKRAVEIAIEQDEQTANDWLKAETARTKLSQN